MTYRSKATRAGHAMTSAMMRAPLPQVAPEQLPPTCGNWKQIVNRYGKQVGWLEVLQDGRVGRFVYL